MSLFKRCAHRGRQRDDCDHPWWSTVMVRRRRVQESLEVLFKRRVRGRGAKTLARTLEDEFHKDLVEGRYAARKAQIEGLNIPKHGLTLDEFIPVYKEQYFDRRKLRSWNNDRRWKLGKLSRMGWGPRLLEDITETDIDNVLDALRAEESEPSTVRRYYALIRQMFGWAARKGYIGKTPVPSHGLELEAEDNQRDRRVSDEEQTLLGAHAVDQFIADAMQVSLETTLRKGSLLKMQVGHIDWRRGAEMPGRLIRHHGLIKLPGSALKQKRPIVIPMTSTTRKILERRAKAIEEKPDGFLFGNEVGEAYDSTTPINKRWYATLVAAGLKAYEDVEKGVEAVDPDLEWRDLRAEGASRLAEMGVPIDTIRRLLGHATLAQTVRYLRPRVAHLDELVAAMENYLPMMETLSRRLTTKFATPLRLAPKKGRS